MSALTCMVITNDATRAKLSVQAGVTRIMVDLESIGKADRQPAGSLISAHSVDDVSAIRAAVPNAELVVRINPYGAQSEYEIDQACTRGANFIMLPMVMDADQMQRVKRLIAGRAKLVPLIEHIHALNNCAAILDAGADEAYLGLNDLHLSLSQHFMFEPLASGMVDDFAKLCKQRGLAFGFGGVGKMGAGQLPADLVIAEHARLGSSRVIISRAFDRALASEGLNSDADYICGISAILSAYANAVARSPAQVIADKATCQHAVETIVSRLAATAQQKNACQS